MGLVSNVRTAVRVGVDVMAVGEVQRSIDAFGDRYLTRVFTEHELACTAGDDATRARGLAARFAAKEATLKVLHTQDAQPDWRSIEVRRTAGGWCEIKLSGRAADLAHQQAISDLDVSMSHEGSTAVAVVVAACAEQRGSEL